ncbi:DUF2273 domain-containing protein [Aerococcus sanguinicola]|uniref:DUF2273 domain-containing protein n=1 Tax=Aerococcus sanguinicola TaxID=119206 RepID=A0A2I1MTQ2_9LACT|nr:MULTISPECIES: DUF2273 domain-containing protein [Aerococcus]KAB0645935.1 DUF2273 domain-containing protein [Aerococcus sanguinicola]MDK6234161.1 DUF2273 domain-containing protein [Aerococcus sp. UMB10185]MDK6805075.1 DUF2273 domain-containing protein [Aerococcus sp. UMB7834]MDK6856247.1 DUF2273 domain-containing protein [Aerococcus sp. UMB7533]MDK7049372.1 DUF2273 domain-containing protein [Aerococcus sanguinicola]
MKQPPESWYAYRWRIICTAAAFLFTVISLASNIGTAILVAVLAVAGFYAGKYFDKNL